MSGAVILAIVLVVVLVAAVAALASHGRRDGGRGLRRRFGPEYDRLAEQRGDAKAAEQELAERVREHDALTLRPLTPDEREHLTQAWTAVEVRFIDDPRGAARQADQVVTGLLTAIGYPEQDREHQLELASVDHAYALTDYRQAHDLVERAAADNGYGDGDGRGMQAQTAERDGSDGQASGVGDPTETLRQAVLHYRVMFKDLLDSTPVSEQAHTTR